MHPDWVREIRDKCEEAGVPFFFKQWGAWRPASTDPTGILDDMMALVGKKAAGREFDGQIYDGQIYDGYPDGH